MRVHRTGNFVNLSAARGIVLESRKVIHCLRKVNTLIETAEKSARVLKDVTY
jgi:hypothetical protein